MKILLSTICIALMALFAYQVMSYPLEDANTQNHNLDKNLAKSVDYKLPSLAVLNKIDEYSDIVQRPLFSKDRAAVVSKQKVNKVTTVNELAHLILVGTARSSDVEIAIVADTKVKQMERLKTGEKYSDWDISEISSDYVVFQNNELEYKLFVTPIKGSQKEKQAKLISQLNKSKINRTAAEIRSNQKPSNSAEANKQTKSKRSISERSWGYNKKYKPANNSSTNDTSKKANTSVKVDKRSPIKIPRAEERDADFYEGLGDDESSSNARASVARDITAEDFYNDEDISEDELKLLESLGAKIFE